MLLIEGLDRFCQEDSMRLISSVHYITNVCLITRFYGISAFDDFRMTIQCAVLLVAGFSLSLLPPSCTLFNAHALNK